MSQFNRITTHCLPLRWWVGALAHAVTSILLVFVQFIRGWHPVVAGGMRQQTPSRLCESVHNCVYV